MGLRFVIAAAALRARSRQLHVCDAWRQSHASAMNIVILAYLEPGETEPDVVMEQIARALRSSGHAAEVLAICDDAAEVVAKLQKLAPDLVFNLVESFGDDILGGQMGVAGLLDLLEVPYTGGGPGEIFLQEDKALAKKLLAFERIPYPRFATFAPGAAFETGGNLRMPLFVKPLRMDASIGIDEHSLVRSTEELMKRVLHINQKIGDAALAEEYIEGREFYVGVLGNGPTARALPPVEIDFTGFPEGVPKVMDSKAKWDERSKEYKGTRSVLATIPDELRARLQKVAVDAYRALRVRDYGRVDIRLTETGEIYVLEVNASCYLEKSSEFAMAAAAAGLDYPRLIEQIFNLALERYRRRR